MEIHCFAPPLFECQHEYPYSYCNCDRNHLQVVYLLKEKGATGCEGHHKESFKGSKTGIGFLHVGLLSRHGGIDAVLFLRNNELHTM